MNLTLRADRDYEKWLMEAIDGMDEDERAGLQAVATFNGQSLEGAVQQMVGNRLRPRRQFSLVQSRD